MDNMSTAKLSSPANHDTIDPNTVIAVGAIAMNFISTLKTCPLIKIMNLMI